MLTRKTFLRLKAASIGFDVTLRKKQLMSLHWLFKDQLHESSEKYGCCGLDELKPFGLIHNEFSGSELMISRTGFTGDLGYELWISPDKAIELWDSFEATKNTE